jgi:hypothetical protein
MCAAIAEPRLRWTDQQRNMSGTRGEKNGPRLSGQHFTNPSGLLARSHLTPAGLKRV